MKWTLTVKGSVDADDVRRFTERPLARLRRRLIRLAGDSARLRMFVREVEGKPRAEAMLVLRIPSRTLSVSEEGVDVRTALHEAFAELERLLEKEAARLHRAASWRRSREEFRRKLLAGLEERTQESPSNAGTEAILLHLEGLMRFVQREIRWLEFNGDLIPGELAPDEIVDMAVARAVGSRAGPPSLPSLIRCASAALREELQRVRASEGQVRIEDTVRAPAFERSVTREDERFEYYQPDAALRMEDLVAGLGPTPEEIEIGAELSAALHDGLAALPANWRQAFELRHVEGLDESAVARALNLDPDEAVRILGKAAAFLRSRLEDAGLIGPSPNER